LNLVFVSPAAETIQLLVVLTNDMVVVIDQVLTLGNMCLGLLFKGSSCSFADILDSVLLVEYLVLEFFSSSVGALLVGCNIEVTNHSIKFFLADLLAGFLHVVVELAHVDVSCHVTE
jgi:hypothetical protein